MSQMLNMFKLFENKSSEELSFDYFKDIFNASFDINDFKKESERDIQENYSKAFFENPKYLNSIQIVELIKSSVEKIRQDISNRETTISDISNEDILIYKISFSHDIHTPNTYREYTDVYNIEIIYCIKNVLVRENDNATYKRLFHATRKHLQNNTTATTVKKENLTPFINMTDEDFSVFKKTKLIDSIAIKEIEKARKAKKLIN